MTSSSATIPLHPISSNTVEQATMPLTDEQRAAVWARVNANMARVRDEHYPEYLAKYRDMKARRDARRAAAAAQLTAPESSARSQQKDPLKNWSARKEPLGKKASVTEIGDSEDSEDEEVGTTKTSDYVGFGHEISTQEAFGGPSQKAAKSVPAKRPAPAPVRRLELPMIHKRPRNSISTAPVPKAPGSSAVAASASSTKSSRSQPDWYRNTQVPKSRGRDQANADGALDRLKEEIRKLKKLTASDGLRPFRNEFLTIRDYLHSLVFLQVDAKLLRAKRMLHNEDGLPQIFDQAFCAGVPWPWDVRADAEELCNKWCHGDFDTDIYRGIVRGKPAKKGKGKSGDATGSGDKLADNAGEYKLMNTHEYGNGKLLNGQWV